MKVVLIRDTSGLGQAGDVKEVRKGYARNYLLPQGLALPATPSNLKTWEERRKAVERQQAQIEAELNALAQKLEGVSLKIKAKVGAEGRLYGSITSAHIADELRHQGIEIDRKRIELPQPLRDLGSYEVTVRLGGGLTPKVKVMVES